MSIWFWVDFGLFLSGLIPNQYRAWYILGITLV